MARNPKLPRREPWAPPAYDEADVGAVKALGSDPRHAHALALIVNRIASTYDQSFRPGGLDGQRASDFAEGRRYVGLQIVKLINMDMPAKP